MPRRAYQLGLLVATLLLCPPVLLRGAPAAPVAAAAAAPVDPVQLTRWTQATVADFAAGTFVGVAASMSGDGEIRLLEGRSQGSYTSPPFESSAPIRAAGLLYRGRTPGGSTLSFQLRFRTKTGEWSSWVPLSIGPWTDGDGRTAAETLVTLSESSQVLQYQALFTGDSAGNAVPVLDEVVLAAMNAPDALAASTVPPWQEADRLPRPVPPDEWGAVPVTETHGALSDVMRVEVRPATVAAAGATAAGPQLRMLQFFQRELLGYPDTLFSYLIDSTGRVYQGSSMPADGILYVGILDAAPNEAVSATVEDALVAWYSWWQAQLPTERTGVPIEAPADLLLGERIQARVESGALRTSTWYLARGVTGANLDEWLLLANPGDTRSRVTVELVRENNRITQRILNVPGRSRASLFVDQLLSSSSFWTRVQADNPVLVERATYFGHDADDSLATDHLAQTWYLPGGTQEAGYTTTVSLLNPGDEVVTATVTLFDQAGPAGLGVVSLPPLSHLDLPLFQLYTGTAPLGSRVVATGPIAAEQAVRFSAAEGGYSMPGTPALYQQWLFPGVETQGPFSTRLALLNPYTETVAATLTLMSEDGTTLQRRYSIQPGEQILNMNAVLPDLALAANLYTSRPIAAARVTFFNGMRSAQAELGAPRAACHWYLPEGATADPYETYLLVANPNGVSANLDVSFWGSAGRLGGLRLRMPAYSRLTVPLDESVPGASAFFTQVDADWPVAVERSMYMHGQEGGHASLGVPR